MPIGFYQKNGKTRPITSTKTVLKRTRIGSNQAATVKKRPYARAQRSRQQTLPPPPPTVPEEIPQEAPYPPPTPEPVIMGQDGQWHPISRRAFDRLRRLLSEAAVTDENGVVTITRRMRYIHFLSEYAKMGGDFRFVESLLRQAGQWDPINDIRVAD